MYYWRKVKASKNPVSRLYYKIRLRRQYKMSGIEIPQSVKLGKGLSLLHGFGITVNSKAVIGDNCVLMKGCTIGNVKKADGAKAPVIGNRVYIGLNSSVVGGIHIGDDVLIAANTFVNFDVPSHSVVIGSPGVIHHKEDATKYYIKNQEK